jgi:hypothetical protein
MSEEIDNLEELLEQIEKAKKEGDPVSLESIVNAVGRRSFGPLLLMAGVILASPLSGIPGMPTAMSLLVLLIAVQMLCGREGFWLPRWLLNRSVQRGKVEKALGWLRPPARFIDRWLRPRLTALVQRAGAYVVAGVCILIAAGMPAMELVPFSATVAGVALAVFGLALVARDGVLALIGYGFAAATAGLAVYKLLS